MDSCCDLVAGQHVTHRLFPGLFQVTEVIIPGNMVKVEGLRWDRATGQQEPDGSSWFLFWEDLEIKEDNV